MWSTPDIPTQCPVRLCKAFMQRHPPEMCAAGLPFYPHCCSSQQSPQADILVVQKAIQSWRSWLIRVGFKVKGRIIKQGRQWFKLSVQQMSLIPQLRSCLDTRASPASVTTRNHHHWISRGPYRISWAPPRLTLVRANKRQIYTQTNFAVLRVSWATCFIQQIYS